MSSIYIDSGFWLWNAVKVKSIPAERGSIMSRKVSQAEAEAYVAALLSAGDDEQASEGDVLVQPKVAKCKCKVCGFHKKARRVNAEGICKTCYITLATIPPCTDLEDQSIVVVGRQGRKGRNTVSVMVGGQRVKVQRKVRIDAETEV
jgi:predicted Zn-ribbon and HTH transcriptional regulator